MINRRDLLLGSAASLVAASLPVQALNDHSMHNMRAATNDHSAHNSMNCPW